MLKRKKYAAGFKQRLGFLPEFKKDSRPVIWVHCVSVGETNASLPLIDKILKHFPNYRLVVSTTTKTGQELAKKLFADKADLVFYFPFDWRFSVRKVLRKIQPNIILIMETELWFNFIREAHRHYAQVFIVNGRISEKSAKNYLWIKGLIKSTFRKVELALMQTSKDANRLMKLGLNARKVKVTGNFKFDQQIDEQDKHLTFYFEERFGFSSDRPLILSASTHAPEEKWILQAFEKIYRSKTSNLPRLLIVPRHPERFSEVAELIDKTDFSWAKRTSPLSPEDEFADVILLDSIGELRSIYSLADIVFVGGSLIPHGGQNILEPALAKKAIITGGYTMNFEEIVNKFLKYKAVIQLPKLEADQIPEKLAETFRELLENKNLRNELAENALEVMKKNRGAADRTLKYLVPYLQVQNQMPSQKKLEQNNIQGNENSENLIAGR
ncbi:MAG: 3-deoxy-D-manno-octulosonic acid transferase [Aridibacter sp.]